MFVVIHDDVFANASDAALMALFYLCEPAHHEGIAAPRHCVLIEPLPQLVRNPAVTEGVAVIGACEAFIGWLARFDEATQDALTNVVELGIDRALWAPAAPTLHIEVGAALEERGGGSLAASLLVALQVLMQPLRVLVEHSINDRCFVENVPSEQRAQLQRAQRLGWLRFEHAGGVDSMPQLLGAALDEERSRMFVIADRDSDDATPSEDARAVGAACSSRSPRVPHHIWERRAIENYIPREALSRFPTMQQASEGDAAAFNARLTALWRDHDAADDVGWRTRYGMRLKKVLAGQGTPGRALATLFDPDARGQHIRDEEWERWMAAEGTAAELLLVVQEILRRL